MKKHSAPRGLRSARRLHFLLIALLLLISGAGAIAFLPFNAEDAFITYRYAENLVNHGALVFNRGEPINALTSPLHALISAGLYALTGNTPAANKLLGFGMLAATLFLVRRRFRERPPAQLLALALLAPSSCILLWSFGGLETPILMFCATAILLFVERRSAERFDFVSLTLICIASGLAFLLRYDSILFFFPAILHAATRNRRFGEFLSAAILGALLPLGWLAISVAYYGDLFPTSFHVKTPELHPLILLKNGAYTAFQLVTTGLIPLLLFSFFGPGRRWISSGDFRKRLTSYRWLAAGIALELLYGCTVATTHMMFSFRFFVPYLPAAAILLLVMSRIGESDAAGIPSASPSMRKPALLFALCLIHFQGFLLFRTYTASLNGFSFIGEYRRIGVAEYEKFLGLLKREAGDIERDWKRRPEKERRPPRIHTFAAGVLPHELRDAHIFERLVSYRRGAPADYDSLNKFAADYLHILAPRHGSIPEQLPEPEEKYLLISKYEMEFDGSRQEFLVYYNPHPVFRIR